MNERKKAYIEFCSKRADLPLFFQHWYLDAVANDEEWDVVSYHANNQINAVLPFHYKKKLGFSKIVIPILQPYLGVFLYSDENIKVEDSESSGRKAITECLVQLPKMDDIRMKLMSNIQNWLPFYWQRFQQTTRYTYLIDKPTIYKDSLQRQINKAKKIIQIQEGNDIDEIFPLLNHTFEKKGTKNLYSKAELIKFDTALQQHQSRKILKAIDNQHNVIAFIYLVWDISVVYYLFGGLDDKHKISGAKSLLFDTAINFALSTNRVFNFEGSMIEGVERFFRSFGGQLTPYHSVWRTDNMILKKLL